MFLSGPSDPDFYSPRHLLSALRAEISTLRPFGPKSLLLSRRQLATVATIKKTMYWPEEDHGCLLFGSYRYDESEN